MTDRSSDEDLAELVRELVRALRDLERELEAPDDRGPPGLPSLGNLRRFTSEVAIPGLILVLETNVRALRLLQRALELGDDAGRASEEAASLTDRATAASETTLERLDDALERLQHSVEGRPGDDDAAELLEEARDLRAEVQSRLADHSDGSSDGSASQEIDVDAELESIRDEIDADDGDEPGSDDDPGGDT